MVGDTSSGAMTADAVSAFDLVVFDCDGVLVDSEGLSTRCLTESLRAIGYAVDEATAQERFMGISNPSMCEIVEREMRHPLPPGFLDGLRRRLLDVTAEDLRPIDGVGDAIDGLGVPCCVASSSHPDRIRRYLEVTALTARLGRHIFSATMVERGKPAPDLFLFAAKQMGARPDRCVVIEDSPAGIRAGKAAGMTVFGFTGGSHVSRTAHGPKLLAEGADLVFDAMPELPALLRSHSAGGR